MSQWCRSALCDHPMPALTDNWSHGAASRHTIAPISHSRPSPRSRSYYLFSVPLTVGGWYTNVSNTYSRMRTITGQPSASSSAECSRDKLPFSFVRGQDSTMWDIVWVSPQRHRSDTPTDRQTDNAHRHKPRLCIALRGNKTSVRPLRRSEMRSAGGSGGALRRLTVTSPTWPTERERRHGRTRRHQIRQHDAIHTYTQTQTYRETGTETVQRDRQRVSSRSANVYATDQTGLH